MFSRHWYYSICLWYFLSIVKKNFKLNEEDIYIFQKLNWKFIKHTVLLPYGILKYKLCLGWFRIGLYWMCPFPPFLYNNNE